MRQERGTVTTRCKQRKAAIQDWKAVLLATEITHFTVGRKVLEMLLPGKRKRRRRKRRYLDAVKEDMREVGAREDEVCGCGEGGHAGGRR